MAGIGRLLAGRPVPVFIRGCAEMKRIRRAACMAALMLPAFAAPSRTETASTYHMPGRKTASGQLYSNTRSEFASRHLPFGTKVQFTYRGRRAIGVCTDRGPYVRGRSLDLNRHLARRLGFNGVASVQVKILKGVKK